MQTNPLACTNRSNAFICIDDVYRVNLCIAIAMLISCILNKSASGKWVS